MTSFLWSVADVAEWHGLTRRQVHQEVARGNLPCYLRDVPWRQTHRTDDMWCRFTTAALDAWASARVGR